MMTWTCASWGKQPW